ncbi:PseudoU_synth_1 domain-containing protein [Cephalotus follicularis]|uniref:tRNA pseudouridine synthase n=1 Tax=Cephalotus follicularis TaxID=3775 RepID=A0A1Q3CYP5_CEPFO|nr:PseudoU_synth_1 domain-containing protein [Cephalotus follicularis]
MSYAVSVAGVPSPLYPNWCISSTNNIPSPLNAEDPHRILKATVRNPGYKWRLVIAYDGTHYAGWQFQQSPPTIQCIVEQSLIRVTKLERKDLQLVGASRTDAGVHAWGQVAHFITPFNYDTLEGIHAALNGLLPSDIRVREISPAVPDFHARFSAKSKIYHYKIYNDAIMDPFQRHYAYHSTYKLNTAVMKVAAKHFIGRHDFSAFANASRNNRIPDPVKTIFRFDVIEMGALLQLEVEGSGFLYRQVRNMVALLLHIGKEAIPPDVVPMILATRDRKELAKYALSAQPHGLCLVSIKYNEEHLWPPSGCPKTSFGRHHNISKCKLPFY